MTRKISITFVASLILPLFAVAEPTRNWPVSAHPTSLNEIATAENTYVGMTMEEEEPTVELTEASVMVFCDGRCTPEEIRRKTMQHHTSLIAYRPDANCKTFLTALNGRASFYGKGDGFAGGTTACGTRMNPKENTAALRVDLFRSLGGHKSMCGRTAVITRVDTGQTINVVIEDNGPLAPGRVIDLSYNAARQLNFINNGTAKVKVQICETKPTPAKRRR